MMRAHNLGSLVNHTPPADRCSGGGSGGGGGAAAVTTAEVVLHFDVLQASPEERPQQQPSDDGGDNNGGDGGANNGSRQPAVAAVAGSASPAAEPSVVGRLLVRRRVNSAGCSDLAVRQLPAGVGQQGQEGGGGGGGQWRGTTPAVLRDLLTPFGVQTEAVDRHVGRLPSMHSSTDSLA